MDSKLKKRWVEALRSKKYKQGRSYLKNTETVNGTPKYCCIGVLCELITNTKFGKENRLKFDCNGVFDGEFGGSRTTLLSPIRDYYKISDNEVGELIRMNDLEKRKFTTIAKYIEENL
jgi:hypothetical protein